MIDTAALRASIDAYVDEVWPDVVADIADLVSVPSVADPALAEPGSPHGPLAHEALTRGLAIATKLGLDAHDCEGWMGYADLPGTSEKQVATIAHVDVVPAGTGWTQDPWTLTEREGYLIGRGVCDDKGPAVLSMYAAHYFARQGAELPYTLRVMLGSDEEVGMSDVEYYLKNYPEPAFLFTPDAEFPACCGEKGHVYASFTAPVATDSAIVAFDGGTVKNAVPSEAVVTLRADAANLPAAEGITIDAAGEGLAQLTAHGIGGHASMPAGTRNAIGMLVNYLVSNGLVADAEKPYFQMLTLIMASTDGSTLGIDATDDIFDPLTCIGGTMHLVDGVMEQTIDIRYPKSITGAVIAERLGTLAAANGTGFELTDDTVPFWTSPDNPAIVACIDAYNLYTGRDAKPFTMGGGTYARHFKNACSFGPEDPSETQPEWVGPMHGADEGISVELMRRSLKIYIYTIAQLMELEF